MIGDIIKGTPRIIWLNRNEKAILAVGAATLNYGRTWFICLFDHIGKDGKQLDYCVLTRLPQNYKTSEETLQAAKKWLGTSLT